MKPRFFPYLSLITVILVAASCGKKDSDGVEVLAPQPAAPAPAPYPPNVPSPPNPPTPSYPDLQTQCWNDGGIYYSQGICKRQITIKLSWNWLVGSITTQTMIYFNDIVSVESDGSPKIFVGNVSHGRNGTFVAQASGLLGFKGDDFESYRIRNIHITRCYSTIGSVACP